MKQNDYYKIQFATKNTIENLMKDEKLKGYGRLFLALKLEEKLLEELPTRYKNVLSFRFGFEDGISHTLEETAIKFGVTRERIRQIESKTLEMLRKKIETWKL